MNDLIKSILMQAVKEDATYTQDFIEGIEYGIKAALTREPEQGDETHEIKVHPQGLWFGEYCFLSWDGIENALNGCIAREQYKKFLAKGVPNKAAMPKQGGWLPIEKMGEVLGGEQFLMSDGELVLPAEYTGNTGEFHYYNITCFHDFEIIPQFKPTHFIPLPLPPSNMKGASDFYKIATDKAMEGKDFTAYSRVSLDDNGDVKVEPITESMYLDAAQPPVKAGEV
jgi:hypothetical protein